MHTPLKQEVYIYTMKSILLVMISYNDKCTADQRTNSVSKSNSSCYDTLHVQREGELCAICHIKHPP